MRRNRIWFELHFRRCDFRMETWRSLRFSLRCVVKCKLRLYCWFLFHVFLLVLLFVWDHCSFKFCLSNIISKRLENRIFIRWRVDSWNVLEKLIQFWLGFGKIVALSIFLLLYISSIAFSWNHFDIRLDLGISTWYHWRSLNWHLRTEGIEIWKKIC